MKKIVQQLVMLPFSLPFTEFSSCETQTRSDVVFCQKMANECQMIKALTLQQIEYLYKLKE